MEKLNIVSKYIKHISREQTTKQQNTRFWHTSNSLQDKLKIGPFKPPQI